MADQKTVLVVGASGTLGSHIVEALIEKGAHVRAMVRATSNRERLKALGVTDFVVGDLNDPTSLEQVMAAEPRADAVVSSAAGFTAHSARTKADNSRTDTEGYRSLVDAAKRAGVPRFVLISILACDKAPGIPHFSQKCATEKHLAKVGLPYLSLRAGAFLDRARDIVPERLAKGEFPDILPGVPMALVYSRDLARYAAQAAVDLPDGAMNRNVDIGCEVPATGAMAAEAFSRALGRRIVARPVFPRIVFPFARLAGLFMPRLRDNLAVVAWLRKGEYVNHDTATQRSLFGDLPTIDQAVARYCRDKGLVAA